MMNREKRRTTAVRLKNGFYIEVADKGAKTGMKIRSDSRSAMEDTAGRYAKYKKVSILGEYKDGILFREIPVS